MAQPLPPTVIRRRERWRRFRSRLGLTLGVACLGALALGAFIATGR